MRGRKPDELAQRHKNKLTPLAERLGDAKASPVLTIPSDIERDPLQKKCWNWICPHGSRFKDTDLPLLRAYCQEFAMLEQARAVLYDSSSGTQRIILAKNRGDGSKSLSVNPAVKIVHDCTNNLIRLGDALGLSPLARSRINLMDSSTAKNAASIKNEIWEIVNNGGV